MSIPNDSSADFWLNLQRAVDLHQAKLALADDIRNIKPLRVA
ncbi:plasmid maintenance system antidote protein VapI [Desulfomicrobium macestii]|uniref:Plasmid maintenance system antidote protein VapI n=1 Tax=Desulfomicrobium macestii TaxID=90731 RepID=A0ABR9H4B8_9BACT|nr:hypothetical protein [Desulfomicrobium macestii]MBE1425551.1 plasmid maintenance system antidote protein VapI [Desulfomicrobium macestii]